MQTRKEKGFTMMELLIVLVIIAVLAAIAIAHYANYVKSAQASQCAGNMANACSIAAAQWGNTGAAATRSAANATCTVHNDGSISLGAVATGCVCAISFTGAITCEVS